MPGPAANNEQVVGQLAQVWSSVAEACQRVRIEQWDRPTDCPGWTVKDQLAHLIGIERMLLGDASPPELAEAPPHVKNPFGALNESWVEARRPVPGPEVLSEFVETTGRRLEALRALPPAEFDRVGWSPVGEVPYREFMVTRILDSWAHEQDIRRALGRPGGRNGVGEAAVLSRCEQTMPYVVGKRAASSNGTSVLFAVTGVMGRHVLVVVEDGRGVLAPAPPEVPPRVALHMDQETFWRLAFGRVEPSAVVATGQVRVVGDVGTGHKVLDAMAFMI
ncbi:MAG: maleylpyruvate isomerase family mycothiol-dependent enzyme [Acidimicrobiales bacterium]